MSKNKEEIKDVSTEQETVTLTTEALQQKETELNAREEALQQKEAELSEREIKVLECEAELVRSENATEVVKEPQKGLEFEFREAQYKFADDAPKSILFQGEVRTQEDLAKDEDALVILIGGHSPLIKRQ